MSIKRKIIKIETPPGEPGFLGAGHVARSVVRNNFSQSDPFILLMDDMLDKKDDEPVGGPHPHAGFETVSLMLEGEIGDEKHRMKGGDFQIMTAGSGIVHTETIDKAAKMRLLQLWVTLPKNERWTLPRVQDLPLEHVPSLDEEGMQLRLYSGELAGLTSPIQNYVPMIIADVSLEAGVTKVLDIPANFNAFIYVIEGSGKVGEDEKILRKDQSGWLNIVRDEELSELKVSAGDEKLRFVLYAGKPQGDPIVSYGPFIGDTSEDIKRLYEDYRRGRMNHISAVPGKQRISL